MRRMGFALTLLLLLAACAAPTSGPEQARQALLGLGERAAGQVLAVPELQPPEQQVLLLTRPEVDDDLPIGSDGMLESLSRGLLGAMPGPQVLNWRPSMASASDAHQWRLESRLAAAGPRLRLSDRELLPYRLTLTLHRFSSDEALWRTHIDGAFDADAL